MELCSKPIPNQIFRNKGLFWIASRPGQARGSLRADNARVWWARMTHEQRIRQLAFIENKDEIESDWDIEL